MSEWDSSPLTLPCSNPAAFSKLPSRHRSTQPSMSCPALPLILLNLPLVRRKAEFIALAHWSHISCSQQLPPREIPGGGQRGSPCDVQQCSPAHGVKSPPGAWGNQLFPGTGYPSTAEYRKHRIANHGWRITFAFLPIQNAAFWRSPLLSSARRAVAIQWWKKKLDNFGGINQVCASSTAKNADGDYPRLSDRGFCFDVQLCQAASTQTAKLPGNTPTSPSRTEIPRHITLNLQRR